MYRYTRLPFGIASALAIFQRTMDTILKESLIAICNIDDILIPGRTDDILIPGRTDDILIPGRTDEIHCRI